MSDVHFWFDPVCPFAWMTSTWVRQVADQRGLQVRWRPISLRLLNRDVDYDARFPAGYEASHTAGLRLLRVCALAGREHGDDAVGRLYAELGARTWEVAGGLDGLPGRLPALLGEALPAAGLPLGLADALEDADTWDAHLQAETDAALEQVGKDVGTPVLHVEPPGGIAFFGPVISRRPSAEEAVELWDHVVGLARFAGFAELKRSLRERPQLPAWGWVPGEGGAGEQEDWHGGSRRQKQDQGTPAP